MRIKWVKQSPPACFYFEVNNEPYLIDITDRKELAHNPRDYKLYFKANYDQGREYPENVRPSINGTTLTRRNVQPLEKYRTYDLVWLAGISGGRPHKVAMALALKSLPLKSKIALKMVSEDDDSRWGRRLRKGGVEVWKNNLPYKKWLEWNKQAKWNVLNRGKHDCLSFKMVDYMSIGSAVLVDYPPTSKWNNPVIENENFLSMGLSGPQTNDITDKEFKDLLDEYMNKANSLLPLLNDESARKRIAKNNHDFYMQHVNNGQAAREVLAEIVARG